MKGAVPLSRCNDCGADWTSDHKCAPQFIFWGKDGDTAWECLFCGWIDNIYDHEHFGTGDLCKHNDTGKIWRWDGLAWVDP